MIDEFEGQLSRVILDQTGEVRKLNTIMMLELCKQRQICPVCGQKCNKVSQKNYNCGECGPKLSRFKAKYRHYSLDEIYAYMWLSTPQNRYIFKKLYTNLNENVTPTETLMIKNIETNKHLIPVNKIIVAEPDLQLRNEADQKIENYMRLYHYDRTMCTVQELIEACKTHKICPVCGRPVFAKSHISLSRYNLHCAKCSPRVSTLLRKLSATSDAYAHIWLHDLDRYAHVAESVTSKSTMNETDFQILTFRKKQESIKKEWEELEEKIQNLILESKNQDSTENG